MSILKEIAHLEESGSGGAVCTVVSSRGSAPRHAGSKMLVYPDGKFSGTIGGGELEQRVLFEAIRIIKDGYAKLVTYSLVNLEQGDPGVCGGTVDIFIEPIKSSPVVLVVGGGHVGKAVGHLAKWLGFSVGISDDRPDFCNKEAHPDGDNFYPVPMTSLPAVANITPQTYIVMTTRGVKVDIAGLPVLLDTPAAYIGLIGSKRRWLTTRQALVQQGIPDEKISRIQSPIGLELQAETPEEIALSIMAEIVMIKNKGTGDRMAI